MLCIHGTGLHPGYYITPNLYCMKHVFVFIAAAVMITSACNSGSEKKLSAENSPQSVSAVSASDTITTPSSPLPARITGDWDRKIIRHATIRLEIPDYEKYNRTIRESLKRYGAYISEEEQQSNDYQKRNRITIRVPVEQFDAFTMMLPTDSARVDEKKISSEDVSSAYVDIQARAEAKKQTREKYLSFLKDAKNMKDALDIQREINGIQEQIESARGRMQYLSHQADYSTIDLEYYQQLSGSHSTIKPNFINEFADAVLSGFITLGEILLILVRIWPLWLIIFISWRLIRRKSLFVKNKTP